MTPVLINVTALGFNVKVNTLGELLEAPHVYIGQYVQKFKNFRYDPQSRTRVLEGEFFFFDIKTGVCYFPRYDLDNFKQFLIDKHAQFVVNEIPPEPGTPVSFEMLSHITYKNDKQKTCVEYLTNPASGVQRGVNLQTGEGKTVATIMALQKHGVRSMITMTSRIEQWIREIKAYTTLDDDDIYVIQGIGSLNKLFSRLGKDINPKIILASTKTVRNYIEYGPTYQHLPPPTDMCQNLGIGIISTDEYHEHFYTNYLIGLLLNPSIFIPITATFTTSDDFVRDIFNKFVPFDIRFAGGEYNKFVNVTAYQYRSGGHYLQDWMWRSPRGYSQQVFEKYLLTRGRKVLDPLVEGAIIPIIREHYTSIAEPGEKFLFLCSSTKLCDHLVNVFQRHFNDKTVTAFYSGIPESVLKEYDMILSTPGSSGTGRDIKGLRTCMVFESVDSESRNLQFIGRLRGPPQMMNTPEFVYVSFASIPPHSRVHQKRSALFGPRALTFKHRTVG